MKRGKKLIIVCFSEKRDPSLTSQRTMQLMWECIFWKTAMLSDIVVCLVRPVKIA